MKAYRKVVEGDCGDKAPSGNHLLFDWFRFFSHRFTRLAFVPATMKFIDTHNRKKPRHRRNLDEVNTIIDLFRESNIKNRMQGAIGC